MSGSIYFGNFDDSSFAPYENTDSTRLTSDPCAIQAKNLDNDKKLKYITTNHVDLIEAKDKLNFFSIGLKDTLFVPTEKVDTYSSLLNGSAGGELTNCKVRNGFGQLPIPTLPFRGQVSHGDVTIEDSIRNQNQLRKNSCLPRDTKFEQRSFSIFDESKGIETPQAIKSVEKREDGFAFGRMGASTRFIDRFSK
jgi:hypothetical protein